MSEKTIIAWTDHTFNPWMGCHKISPGCKNCYAETLTKNRMGLHLWGPAKTTRRQRTKAPWANVRKWNRRASLAIGVLGEGMPSLCFTASLADVFESHPELIKPRADMWDLMRECENLHFQILTKRPENIEAMLPDDWGNGWPNVWLGTSIENNDYVGRADILRAIPAAIRFISYEPALGPLPDMNLAGIDWLIYGGESGPGYRDHDLQWARDIRELCAESETAFFYKQASAYRTEMGITLDGEIVRRFPDVRKFVLPTQGHLW